MLKKILRVVAIALIAIMTSGVPVLAATIVDISITATPLVTTGITGFTITYVSDQRLDLDWGYGGLATKIMIRGKYGSYPDDIPDEDTAPTDGYLVYYGAGVATSDTTMDFDQSTGVLYYKAWGQKADGKWYVPTATGWEESEVVTLIAIIVFCLGMTFLSFKSSFWILKFLAGLCWLGLMLYWIANPPTAIPAGTPAHQALTVIFIGIALAVAFMGGGQGYMKEKDGEKTEGFRFQIPKFMRGEDEDENGTKKPTVGRRDRFANYSDRINDAVNGRRDVRR